MAEKQPWMDDLEAQVTAAAEEIGRLRDELGELRAENERLREASPEGESEEGTAAWAEERETVRRRVEALASQLESLLADEA